MKQYFVYLIASENNNALYIGFTNNLERRLYEHKNGSIEGFSKKYKCKKLVHFEVFSDPENGILREKELKGWIRKRKNELIEKHNPHWNDLDPSAQALQDDKPNSLNLERYARQLALPEISIGDQKRLSETRILMIGAGGLGAASLPYLASAGIGHITVYDNDTVSISNLHRQTIYKNSEAGKNKAQLAAAYAQSLNPDIEVEAVAEKLTSDHPIIRSSFNLIIDGSDNFETKTLLNDISIKTQTLLLSASVNQWAGQVMLLAGFAKNAPCYHCLFPDLPTDARNCNEAGILGTSAGLTGMIQAHAALCHLLGLDGFIPGMLITLNTKTMRQSVLNIAKDPACPHCKDAKTEWTPIKKDNAMQDMITYDALQKKEYMIVDVRTDDEVKADPIPDDNLIHMELSTIPKHHGELPGDKLLAFVCAGNVRSVQAADYLAAHGYQNTIVLDKFSIKK